MTKEKGRKLLLLTFVMSTAGGVVAIALAAGFSVASKYVTGGGLIRLLGGDVIRWVDARNGEIPKRAVEAGKEKDGKRLYICRVVHKNGRHIGKIRSEFKGCNFPYGGKELNKPAYQVLIR